MSLALDYPAGMAWLELAIWPVFRLLAGYVITGSTPALFIFIPSALGAVYDTYGLVSAVRDPLTC